MSIFDDMDWENTTERGSKYGEKYKTAKAHPKSLGGWDRWTDSSEKTGTAKKSKESESKEFLSRFKSDFANKFRDNA